MERLRQHRSSFSLPQEPSSASLANTQHKLDSVQKRRPSTIAEQAMRKLGIAGLNPPNITGAPSVALTPDTPCYRRSTVETSRNYLSENFTHSLMTPVAQPCVQTSSEIISGLMENQISNSLNRTTQSSTSENIRLLQAQHHPPPFRELQQQSFTQSSTNNQPPVLFQLNPGSNEVVSSSDTLNFSRYRLTGDSYQSLPRYTTPSLCGSFSGSVSSPRPDSGIGITPQYSSSTDEGVETDMEDIPIINHSRSQQRLSYASSSSSSGVGVHNKSLSQHLSSDSSCSSSHVSSLQSNFSTFESSLDYQFESDLASSLPSCTSPGIQKPSMSENVVSTSAIHPCTYTSSNKSWSRHGPLIHNQSVGGQFNHRHITRSPVDFREGRRASDGLVAQHGVAADAPRCSVAPSGNVVAFNSQRLNESGKTKGVMELHLVQREHQALKSLYQSSIPQEEITQRQMQHSEYRHTRDSLTVDPRPSPPLPKRISLPENFSYQTAQMESEAILGSGGTTTPPNTCGKAPLQQQMMQHRLLQQKRQILQKQGAFQQPSVSVEGVLTSGMNLVLSRRQMLRQASYKLAQQTQIVPPLPLLSDSEFPPIIEDSSNGAICPGSGRQLPAQPIMRFDEAMLDANSDQWMSLPSSLASCQISEPNHSWMGQSAGNMCDNSGLLVSSVSSPWQPPLYLSGQQLPSWNQVHK